MPQPTWVLALIVCLCTVQCFAMQDVPLFWPNISPEQNKKLVVTIGEQPSECEFGAMPVREDDGTEYTCCIPDPSARDEVVAPAQTLSDEDAKTILDDMEHLVQWCSSLAEDWWSYEVCYKKGVRQVHFEGGKLTEEYSLGEYDNTTAPVFVPADLDDVEREYAFISYMFVNGSECDLSGVHRTSEVRFMCDLAYESVVTSVREVRSCHYVVEVFSAGLCRYDFFRQPAPQIEQIKCHITATGQSSPSAYQNIEL